MAVHICSKCGYQSVPGEDLPPVDTLCGYCYEKMVQDVDWTTTEEYWIAREEDNSAS